MSKEILRKWNIVCIIVVIVSALVEIIIITAVTYSVHNNSFLSEASDLTIKALAYIPWLTFARINTKLQGLAHKLILVYRDYRQHKRTDASLSKHKEVSVLLCCISK